MESYHMLVFYVPEEHAETVKKAVFEAGGGRLGNYECCCWQTDGCGQFRPLAGSNPFIGAPERIEKVTESRVEMICSAATIQPVITALRQTHPYETPAYAFWPVRLN